MLLRVFFLVFILSLVILTMLATTLFMGKAVLYERALAYIPASYQQALATVAQSIKAGNGSYIAPAPAPLNCISKDSPCSFYAGQTIVVPSQSAPAGARPCDTSSTNCAVNMQEQVIGEGRLGLQINASIYDAGKSLLVRRTKYVTLRTFGVDPFFAVIGERDSAAGDRTQAPEGENAGYAATAAQTDT
ncbi:MAG: hypothetical protein GIW97_05465, partial [Candidatus Eremiobacteraeota bacterium]|nr:hypothetical protein [Candidatus Eremiobacteraeota bacterium]